MYDACYRFLVTLYKNILDSHVLNINMKLPFTLPSLNLVSYLLRFRLTPVIPIMK